MVRSRQKGINAAQHWHEPDALRYRSARGLCRPIDNPIIHSRIIVLKDDGETNGLGWLLEVHRAPHSGPDIAEHLHLTWTETFEIISGTAHYKLNI